MLWYNRGMFYEVIPEGKVEAFTYDFDDSLLPGQIVMVPVGKRVAPGIVMKKVAQPDFKTKSILKVLYSKPLPTHLLKTVSFIHDYYLAASGQAVSTILPKGAEKKRRKTEQMFGLTEVDSSAAACPPDTLRAALAKSSCSVEHIAPSAPATHYIILCPHYEGYDERILSIVDYKISLGKYVLTGGELPALIIIDSVVRLIPGVLGGEQSAQIESFSDGDNLEYPQYTKPYDFRGMTVPDILLSGNHGEIAKWREEHSGKVL